MWSVILFIIFAWMHQHGCISIGDLEDGKTDANSTIKLKGLLLRHSKYSGGGSGFVPETPSSGETLGSRNDRGKTGLKLDEFGNSSYYFSTEKFNYYKAFQFCRIHQMDLLNIESEEENNFITKMLTNLTKIDHVWTSGTDLQEEGNYVWMSTGLRFTFTNWEPRQPDNFINSEHCIEIRKYDQQNYYWNDSYCSYKFNFVCETTNCGKFLQMLNWVVD